MTTQAGVGVLPDIDTPGAEAFQTADLGRLIPVRRRGKIEVQPVPDRLSLGDGDEYQARSLLQERNVPGVIERVRRNHEFFGYRQSI